MSICLRKTGTDHIIWQVAAAEKGVLPRWGIGYLGNVSVTAKDEIGHFGMIDAIDDPQVLPRCLASKGG